MADTVQNSINAGVSVLLALILGVAGMAMVSASNTTVTLDASTQSEWNDVTASTSGNATLQNGEIVLTENPGQGEWTSRSLTVNETGGTLTVNADIPSPENTTLTFGVGSDSTTHYEVEDGDNEFTLTDSEVSSLESGTALYATLETTGSVDAPSITSFNLANVEDAGILGIIAPAGFGLLVLLALIAHFDLGNKLRREP